MLKLKQASLATVVDWSFVDLLDFCDAQRVDSSGSRPSVVLRVEAFKKQEIERVRRTMEADKAAYKKSTDNPENWKIEALRKFCRQNDLSEEGTKSALIIKVNKYKNQQARAGKPIPRAPQSARTDSDGYERYVFRANLGQSSVTALKSALFVAGDFPPETIMTLFFHRDIETLEAQTPAQLLQAESLGHAGLENLHGVAVPIASRSH